LLRTHRRRAATRRAGRHEQAARAAASELGRQGVRHTATSRASHESKPRRALPRASRASRPSSRTGLHTALKPWRGHGRALVARAGLRRTPGATAELRPPWLNRAEVAGGRATPPRRAGRAQGHAEAAGGRATPPRRAGRAHRATAPEPRARPRQETGPREEGGLFYLFSLFSIVHFL
jgi:hypothetical protein